MFDHLEPLPLQSFTENKTILKKAALAHRALAELKGLVHSIPNQGVLISTLVLQEAKSSSAIENIITTHDGLFKEELLPEFTENAAAKEVKDYVEALYTGFELVQKEKLLTNNHIKAIQEKLENNRAGFRKTLGTALKNEQSGEMIYTPPQHPDEIIALMTNLERFINDDTLSSLDPLVRMAIIHHRFESIHPFYDGNGRTGRIINVLYLVQKELLDIPVLYLSRYMVQNKDAYYRLLQEVRLSGNWEAWILYILEGVEETSGQTIETVKEIGEALREYKQAIQSQFRFYSQDLVNNLFRYPYTKIGFIEKDLRVSRLTATKYLDKLSVAGFLVKEKIGRSNYYVNKALYQILTKNEE